MPLSIENRFRNKNRWPDRRSSLIKPLTHQRGETVDRSPQIRRTRGEVDPHRGRQRQHGDRSASSTARTSSGEAPDRTTSHSPVASATLTQHRAPPATTRRHASVPTHPHWHSPLPQRPCTARPQSAPRAHGSLGRTFRAWYIFPSVSSSVVISDRISGCLQEDTSSCRFWQVP